MAKLFLLQDSPVLSIPLLIIIAILLVILFIWLLLRWRASARSTPVEAAPVVRSVDVVPPVAPSVAAVDDLQIIEGIGPKIASILNAAGVTSFAQLAAMTSAEIADVVHAGGIRLADTTSWPEQARLAAAGDQAGLKALQDRLTAGR